MSRVTGEETVPSRAPVSMVHVAIPLMESAHVNKRKVVLARNAVCLAVIIPGGRTVQMLVCVSTMECAIRFDI